MRAAPLLGAARPAHRALTFGAEACKLVAYRTSFRGIDYETFSGELAPRAQTVVALSAGSTSAVSRAAVLIGVDRAGTGTLPVLRDAANGARRMAKWARDQGMDPVVVLTDK